MKESRLDFYKRWGRLAKPYFRWQIRQFYPFLGKRIGDVGCGIGNFAGFFKEKDILYMGFEPDKKLAQEFKRSHAGERVQLAANGDICSDEAVSEIRANRLDTILCINVLEHIEDDKRALANIVDSIAPAGHICLIVPAFMSLYGSLDELDGHYRRYSKRELTLMVKRMEVDVVKCHYMNFPGTLGWFIKGKIIKEKRHGDENFLIGHLAVPLISFIEGIVKPPFGLSIVMVLRKRNRTT